MWLEILATLWCGQDSELQRTDAILQGCTSWNAGPGILTPGLASFLSASLLLPLPNGKIHVASLRILEGMIECACGCLQVCVCKVHFPSYASLCGVSPWHLYSLSPHRLPLPIHFIVF